MDQSFFEQLKDLQRRIKALETNPQPYIGDWIELNPINFSTTTSNNTLISSSIDLTQLFENGDKIRIKNYSTDTNYIYGIVNNINSSSMNVICDDNYPITGSSPIYKISRSKVTTSPSGFPSELLVTTNPTKFNDGSSASGTGVYAYWTVNSIGKVLVGNLQFSLTSSTKTVPIFVPFPTTVATAYDSITSGLSRATGSTNNYCQMIIQNGSGTTGTQGLDMIPIGNIWGTYTNYYISQDILLRMFP